MGWKKSLEDGYDLRDERCNIAVRTDRDEYMDLKCLSKYCGLSVRTLRQDLKDLVHRLPSFRLRPGGKIWVRRSDFDRWMEQFRQESSDLDGLVSKITKELQR